MWLIIVLIVELLKLQNKICLKTNKVSVELNDILEHLIIFMTNYILLVKYYIWHSQKKKKNDVSIRM